MKRLPLTLCLTLVAGLPIGTMGVRPAAAEEAGPRAARFKGVVKAVDARTGRFVVPVVRGRDGDPSRTMVDVLVHTAQRTRFNSPGAEGAAPVAVGIRDLAVGQSVAVQGIIQRDGSVAAQEVTLYRGRAGAEGEGRPAPEAGFRDAGRPREGAGPRDGERPFKEGPRDGERPFKQGPRDGEGGVKRGSRDGEGPAKVGPRDGEAGVKRGPRDGEGPAKVGPREGEGGARGGGEEANPNGFTPGRVKAIDARRNAILFQYREGERGNLRNMEAIVFVTPTTKLFHGRAPREGAEAAAATFRDLQAGAIVHIQASRGPDGFYASEIRVMPLEKRDRRPVGAEGEGRKPAEGEGRRSPEADRKP